MSAIQCFGAECGLKDEQPVSFVLYDIDSIGIKIPVRPDLVGFVKKSQRSHRKSVEVVQMQRSCPGKVKLLSS